MATKKNGHRGVPPSSACQSEPNGPERQPDGRRLIANRPNSAAVKCTYGPRIRAIFDKRYGLVHKTEQRAAATYLTERHRTRLRPRPVTRSMTKKIAERMTSVASTLTKVLSVFVAGDEHRCYGRN